MALTEKSIVEHVYRQRGFPNNQSAEITESLLERIKTTPASGEDVLVSGFGKFCVRDKKGRKGRNPATGEELILPAGRVVMFTCSETLRNRMNGS